MDIDQNFEDDTIFHESGGKGLFCGEQWSSGSEDNSFGKFDCNICLDSVQDPVVTLCGHLFCWPCIYQWMYFQTSSTEPDGEHKPNQQCPVCKSGVSHATLVPIYGRGQTSKGLGTVIPRRPLGPVHGNGVPRSPVNHRLERGFPSQAHVQNPQQGSYTSMMPDPMTRVLCEMVFERLFGNSMPNMPTYENFTDSDYLSRRARRRMMQTYESLGRIYLFLVCSVVLCLFLF